ncbi:hemolymph lipopolysaccharide-binding protein [Anabrus simplex]|uniref:hemolymph lipopolysaccharide-binding protein n=1 Tax=Anabrus simplex TaxID=316456 RepID=UPI0035A3A105
MDDLGSSTMFISTTLGTLALLLASCHGAHKPEAACNSSTARLVLSSEKNRSGDWVARVRLIHDDVNSPSSDKWRVDVVHTVVQCPGNEQLVLMEANVTIPHAALHQPKGLPPPKTTPVPRTRHGNMTSTVAPPEGYIRVPSLHSSYKYYDDWLVWQHARNACEQEGAHLAVPDTEEEYNVLTKLSSKHPWVGIYYSKGKGQYMTVLGQPLSSLPYVRWAKGEPDKSGDCIFYHVLSKTLYDEPCGFVEVYVCEIAS